MPSRTVRNAASNVRPQRFATSYASVRAAFSNACEKIPACSAAARATSSGWRPSSFDSAAHHCSNWTPALGRSFLYRSQTVCLSTRRCSFVTTDDHGGERYRYSSTGATPSIGAVSLRWASNAMPSSNAENHL